VTDLIDSLNRTLLLMRDEFGFEIADGALLDALTSTRVALVADAANIISHSAQTAFVTAAMLMARSGHQVLLMAPDVTMVASQPPLKHGAMIDQLMRVGKDLLPGVEFKIGKQDDVVDLAIGFGDTPLNVRAQWKIRLNAEPWAGAITREDQPSPWGATLWPFGGLAAAGLGAGEAFKIAVRKLLPYALSPENTAARFALIYEARYELASANAPFCRDLGEVDCVSGGAIANSILYCLARIPAVTARGRIIEPDTADLSNLNRNMLLLRSSRGTPKAQGLAEMLGGGLHFQPLLQRFDSHLAANIAPLAPTVIVGVDHVPTRWVVQEAKPEWLVVGATTHWSAMASFHSEGIGCARCLHDKDHSDDGLIATTACVSFWAGLLSAAYLALHAAGQAIATKEQQVYLTPFRPDRVFPSAVAIREDCPICHPASTVRRATA
jgi:hypothetical protein